MNKSWPRSAQGYSPFQGCQRQALLQPVADSPTNDTPREEIEDDREIQPALGGPDIADIDTPLPVGLFTGKVLTQKVGGDRTGVIAVRGFLEAAFFLLAFSALSRISRATRCRPMVKPSADKSTCMRGLP